MRLGEKIFGIFVAIVGVILVGFRMTGVVDLAYASSGAREIVSMTKTVSVANSPQVYDSIALKVKTTQPFKVCVQVYTSEGEYWITYSSTYSGSPKYDQETGMIEARLGESVENGQWNTIELNVSLTLQEEALISGHAPFSLRNIMKISLLGSDFGVRYVSVFYTDSDGSKKYQPLDKDRYGSDNFSLPDITPPSYKKTWQGWELTDPEYFTIQYDENLVSYLQAQGPLSESHSEGSSSQNRTGDAVVYSPTDLGSSYYSPYSALGGYYDNYYGAAWYGGLGYYNYLGYGFPFLYGPFGLGYGGLFGLGYGLLGLGGLFGYGLGGYFYPPPLYGLGYGLGGFGLPYSSYGYPYSLYGGFLNSPLGLGFSSLLGTELSSSDLLSSLSSLPTNTISLPTLVPSTSQVSLSSILGLSNLGISGLSGITVPITTYTPGSTTITLPDLSSLLSSTTSTI